jgi:phosphatidate phosphatase PAH1
VHGDSTGVRFLAYVARAGESVIVTDIDGTITRSENAVVNTVLFGDDVGHRAGAPEALAKSGRTVVYLSSRGDQLTDVTRRWLRTHGFPPGPLRLAPASITIPGGRTVQYKTQSLRSLNVPIFAAIGNKPSDVQAYTNAGVPQTRILVKLPEFAADLRADLAARRAIGFSHYDALQALLQ